MAPLTLSRPDHDADAPARHQQRAVGNDGLTDLQRELLARRHREHVARDLSRRERAAIRAWLKSRDRADMA